MATRRLMAAIAIAAVTLAAAEGYGGRLGGRSEIEDVRANEEVQELGRFCVAEYNRRYGGGEVRFTAVVAAEQQVVAGMKYYMKILGSVNGESDMFDSVVIVKPWLRSKQLLHFSPSGNLIAHKF